MNMHHDAGCQGSSTPQKRTIDTRCNARLSPGQLSLVEKSQRWECFNSFLTSEIGRIEQRVLESIVVVPIRLSDLSLEKKTIWLGMQ